MDTHTDERTPWSDTMLLLLVVWLCTLPLIIWLIVPAFGIQAGLSLAAALLIGLLIICWGLCTRLHR